jgi:hypothetical protein
MPVTRKILPFHITTFTLCLRPTAFILCKAAITRAIYVHILENLGPPHVRMWKFKFSNQIILRLLSATMLEAEPCFIIS